MQPTRRIRLNIPAVLVTIVLLLALIGGFLLYSRFRERALHRDVLAQAQRLEREGEAEMAIKHLDQYLRNRPDDLPCLELQARLLATTAQGPGQVLSAIDVNNRLLRLDPDGADRQETRRRLVELNVAISDFQRASNSYRLAPEKVAPEFRYQAAEVIARQLIARGADDPGAHRLLAMALEGLGVTGDANALTAAIKEYRIALERDPGDTVAASRLALISADQMDDRPGAIAIIEALTRAKPDSVEARLAAFQVYLQLREPGRAGAELAEAIRLKPGDPKVRLMAVQDALRRNDIASARGHLAAIDAKEADATLISVLEGVINLREERPDEAIDTWRRGLLAVSGTDAELTWWLAHSLLRMDRIAEAKPMVDRYRVLVGDDANPLYQLLQAQMDAQAGRTDRAILVLERLGTRLPPEYRGTYHALLGRCYEQMWNLSEAMSTYHAGLQLDPGATELRLAIARLLEDRPDEAVAELERGLAVQPNEPLLRIALARARFRQQALLPPDRRSWAAFDAELAEALKVAPGHPVLTQLQAGRLDASGDLKEGIAHLARAAEAAPKDAKLWISWAAALRRVGRFDEALDVLARASNGEHAGDRADLRVARSEALVAAGRGRDAIALLSTDVEKLPESDRPAVWKALGQLHASQGDLDAARAAYVRWAELVPGDLAPRLAMLDLALASDDDAAIHAVVEALRGTTDKERDLAWRLARVQELVRAPDSGPEGGLKEAQELIGEVLAEAPGLPVANLLKAQLSERLGKDEEAAGFYRQAVDLGVASAMPRLVDLLTRLKRFDELEQLRAPGTAEGHVDPNVARGLQQAGSPERALELADRAAASPAADLENDHRLAELLVGIGRADRAEEILRKAIERQPGDLKARLAMVRFLAQLGRDADLEATIAEIKATIKDDPPELLEARCRWEAGDQAASDRAFEALLKARPEDLIARTLAAIYYHATRRPAMAVACYEKALEIDPSYRPAIWERASLLAEMAQQANDVPGWERAYALLGPESSTPESPDDRLARATVLSRHPDPSRRVQAIERLEKLVADLPGDANQAGPARSLLVRLLIDNKQAERAIGYAQVSSSLGLSPEAVALHVEALLKAGRLDEAATHLERLARTSPGNPLEARLRVELTLARAQPGEAVAALERSVEEFGRSPGALPYARTVYSALAAMGPKAADAAERVGRRIAEREPAAGWMPARYVAQKGDRAEALSLCRAGIETAGPDDLRMIGKTILEIAEAPGANALSQAEPILEAVLRRRPDDADLLVVMAMFRHAQGRYDEEVRLYRRVLELRKGDPVTLNNLAHTLSEGLHQPDEALKLIDEVIRKVGRHGAVLRTRGVILTRAGRFAEAIADLDAAASAVQPATAAAYHFQLSRAHAGAGHAEEARRHLDQARKLGLSPESVDPTAREQVASMMKP